MITIEYKKAFAEIKKDLKNTEKAQQRALNRALLRVSRTMVGRVAKGISAKVRIKQKLIRQRISNKKQRTGGRVVRINAAPVPVILLARNTPKQKKTGIRLAGRHYPQGWVATSRKGRRPGGKSIFEREGKPRGPVNETTIKIEPEVRGNLNRIAVSVFQERFQKEMDSAMKFEVDKAARAAGRSTGRYRSK